MLKRFLIVIESLLTTLVVLVVVFILASLAAEWSNAKAVEIQEVSVNYNQYLPGGHSLIVNDANGLIGKRVDKGLNVIINTDFFSYLFWNNEILSLTDANKENKGQFRYIAYKFEIGIRLFTNVEVAYVHKSEHMLDHKFANRFPVADAIRLNIILFKAKTKPGLLDL